MKKVTEAIGILVTICCIHSSFAFQQAPVSSRSAFPGRVMVPRRSLSRNLSKEDGQQLSSSTIIDTATINGDDSTSSSSSSLTDESQEPQQPRRDTPPPSPPVQQQGLSFDQMMIAMGTSPRRLFLGTLSATGIALAGNFLGVTSKLLTAVPEDVVEKTSLDTYFPRGDFKRCRSKGYTFVIPKEWVADTFVELAKAQRRIQPLDYSMSSPGAKGPNKNTLPDAAYGPAGRLNANGVSESGDTNVSVIVNGGLKGFSLEGTLKSPQNAAEMLLKLSIAPEGSGRVATLLNVDANNGKNYQFEYLLERPKGPPLRNIAVIAASSRGDAFYTLTVVAPASEWEKEAVSTKLRKIANSFHVTV